jgi:hypothetical protein
VNPDELDYTLFPAGELDGYLRAEWQKRDPAGATQLEFLVSRIHGVPTDAADIRSRNQDLINAFPEITHLYETAARQFTCFRRASRWPA